MKRDDLIHQQKAELLQHKVKVVNIGLELFAQSLRQQEVEVVHVAWKPLVKGDPELAKILEKLL
jgi:hypothetical protein